MFNKLLLLILVEIVEDHLSVHIFNGSIDWLFLSIVRLSFQDWDAYGNNR